MQAILAFFEEYAVLTALVRLCAATVMGGCIGLERGRHGRAAGLRTHILICIGAAMTALTSLYLSEHMGYGGDVARLSAQVVSGIGFLGAGIILVRNSTVITGLTTAAGMWTTAAIGIAVGYGFYAGAIIATVICIVTVTMLGIFEPKRVNLVKVYIELSDIDATGEVVALVAADPDTTYDIIPPKTGHPDHVGITVVMAAGDFTAIEKTLLDHPQIDLCLQMGPN